jgi:transcriptional regulator with XRE-family HTH domain
MSNMVDETDPLIDRDLFAHNIQTIRMFTGLTQTELAAKAGISRDTVYQVEHGRCVRLSTLKRICEAISVDFTMTCTVKQTFRFKPSERAYMIHLPEQTVWYEWGDRRRNIPADNLLRIQDCHERSRLGRAGLVPVFISTTSFIMPEGPGNVYLEIYGYYESGINAASYKDGVLHCLRGEVLITIEGETLHLCEGSMVGYNNYIQFGMQPVRPVGPDELPPLLLWIGANRVGRVPKFRMSQPEFAER